MNYPSMYTGNAPQTFSRRVRPLPAANNDYILEEYPSQIRAVPQYDSSYNAFRPITPPYYQPAVATIRPGSYDKPATSYFDTEQIQMNLYPEYAQQPYYGGVHESSPVSEIGFAMDKLGGSRGRVADLEAPAQPKRTQQRRLLHNLFDIVAIAATFLIFGLLFLLIKPFRRGFFCDDESIQYPFKEDTIPMWLLGIYGGIGPIIIFIIVEIWVVRPFSCGRPSTRNSLKERRIDYIKTLLQTLLLFGLGIAICFLITEVGKRTIGRLRPYYLTACNPNWANIACTKTVSTSNGALAISQYITDHNCNPNVSDATLQEARLSFPSGHSSFSTFSFVFLFVYFEARLVCPSVQFFKPFLQCLCIAVAFFTCLSRVTDYKHHATDVIGGAIIGFCIAVFAAVRVGTYLWSLSVYCETENETEKDRLPRSERVAATGLDSNPTMGGARSSHGIPLDDLQGSRAHPVAVARTSNEHVVQPHTKSYPPSLADGIRRS